MNWHWEHTVGGLILAPVFIFVGFILGVMSTDCAHAEDIYPREFNTVEQFTDWYYEQEFKPMPFLDCDDYATRLQIHAFRDC